MALLRVDGDEVAVDPAVLAHLLKHLYVSSQNVTNFLRAYHILVIRLHDHGGFHLLLVLEEFVVFPLN